MPRPMWTGALTFGLVNVPVKLFSAISQKEVHFHMVHAADGGRIRQKRVCEIDGKEVSYDEISKGYELSPGKLVLFSKKELEALNPESNRTIEISDFVDGADIDPVYFENAYHLAPDRGAGKAYELLVAALKKTGKVGIAHMVMRTKGYLCAVRAVGNGLMLSTMLYADEVIPQEDVEGIPEESPKPREKELAMAEQLIDSLAGDFEPERYKDEHRERVLELIEKKSEGESIEAPASPEEPAKVVNLMDALQRSLEAAKKRGGSRNGSGAANDDGSEHDEHTGSKRHRSEAARTASARKSHPTKPKKRKHA